MSAEYQSTHEVFQDLAPVLWGNKWFFPILEELEKFEEVTAHLFPEVHDAIADDAPNWVFMAIWKAGIGWADYNGLGDSRKLDSRRVGMMVGIKWSLCEAYSKSHRVWNALSPEQVQKIDKAWFPGFCHECTEFTREFAEQWAPQFQEVRRKAMLLALDVGLFDEVDYLQGYQQGKQFAAKIIAKMRQQPTHKRGKDELARNSVYFFAMCCGREIEAEKGSLSWPELHQAFCEFIENKVEIDEDTFKRVCYDLKLKGVGKAGRRPSNEIGISKKSRRP